MDMKLKVKVYSDYVCPFCYLGKDQFEKAIKGKEVDVEWLPYNCAQDPLSSWTRQMNQINYNYGTMP